MQPDLVILGGSPRRGGNSARLLAQFAAGAEALGACVEVVWADTLGILPCRGCDRCRTEACIQTDAAPGLLTRLSRASGICVSTPVYFGGVPAPLKALIDRAQADWWRRVDRPFVGPARPGFLLATAGRDRPDAFAGLEQTVRAFFFAQGVRLVGRVLAPGVDAAGEIEAQPSLLKAAEALGREAAQALSPTDTRA